MKKSHLLGSVCVCMLFSGAVLSATITFNHEFNIDGFAPSTVISIEEGTPLAVSDGDDVVLNFTFANNKALSLASISSSNSLNGWLRLVSGSSGLFSISNITLDFPGAITTGGATTSYAKPSEDNGVIHLGPRFANVLPANSSLTFASMTASFHVDSVPGGTNVYKPWLFFSADSVKTVEAVPLPAALWLFGSGLLGLVGMARRKKAA